MIHPGQTGQCDIKQVNQILFEAKHKIFDLLTIASTIIQEEESR